jgi:NDP-sugar pyrophosphorylase family protein
VTAAILAGGLGTRLRSSVPDRPKVLAAVHDRPYLTYVLDQLAGFSIPEVVLLTGYQADQVESTLGDTYSGMRLHYSPEPAPLGTAGAIRRALPKITSPLVLLLNGDSFCVVDLAALLAFHRRTAADLSLVLTQVLDTSHYGAVRVTGAGRVLRFEEKGQRDGPGWINAGIYLLARSLIEEIPPGRSVSLERDMIPTWIKRGKPVFGLSCTGRFLDIGTPESYAAAARFFGS